MTDEGHTLRKTELEQFEYYPDASCHFALDAVVNQDPRPQVRLSAGAPLKLTLLRLVCTVKQYGKHKSSTGVDVWQMVVMDGNKSLLKIVLNSREYQYIPHEELIPGTTLIIQPGDYKFISCKRMKACSEQCSSLILLILTLLHEKNPILLWMSRALSLRNSSTCWLDRSAIDRVEKKSLILFMTSHQHEEGFITGLP